MSIIKDGKVYRTLEEQVYHLTKEQKEMKDTDNSLSNRINQKQDKLTAESVDSGTLDKAIGFDSEGNLVKGNVSADYNDLINKPIINQAEQSTTSPFVDEETIDNGNIIHFDTTKTTEIQSLLDTVTGEQLVLVGGSDFALIVYNLSAMNLGKVILLQDRENEQTSVRVIYGTQSGTAGEISWDEGFNNLDDNGDFTLTLDEPEEIEVNPVEGWNGVFVFLKATTIIPIPENGNYYRKPDGKLYYYNNNEYKQILAEGDLSYDATVIEDSTNAVQGGAVYDALAEKQDVITGSNVELNGVSNGVLGIDANGDLSKAPLSDFLTTSSFPYSSNVMDVILGYDNNGDLCSGNSISTGFIYPGSGNDGKVLKVVSPADPHADWSNVEGDEIKSTGITSGYVLTADGNGGAGWQNASGETTLNQYNKTYSTINIATITEIKNILANAKGYCSGLIYISNYVAIPVSFIRETSDFFGNLISQNDTSYIISGYLSTTYPYYSCRSIQITSAMALSYATITLTKIRIYYSNDTQLHT